MVRQQSGSRKPIRPGKGCNQDPYIGFANQGQLLLMNSASLADMNSCIAEQANKKQTAGGCKGVTVERFVAAGDKRVESFLPFCWGEEMLPTVIWMTIHLLLKRQGLCVLECVDFHGCQQIPSMKGPMYSAGSAFLVVVRKAGQPNV
ncbi:hypothetical protein WJX82_008771 [Trebouxia sp. C0006]